MENNSERLFFLCVSLDSLAIIFLSDCTRFMEDIKCLNKTKSNNEIQ